jgi:hypothetical protein
VLISDGAAVQPGGVPHYRSLLTGTQKLIVNATISNRLNDEYSFEVPLHVDGSCEIADLVLLQSDIVSLGLETVGEVGVGVQVDGSIVYYQEYERVVISLQADNGQTWSATLNTSVVLIEPPSEGAVEVPGVVGSDDTSRLLGYGGLNRLKLKQDFFHHKLIKAIRKA